MCWRADTGSLSWDFFISISLVRHSAPVKLQDVTKQMVKVLILSRPNFQVKNSGLTQGKITHMVTFLLGLFFFIMLQHGNERSLPITGHLAHFWHVRMSSGGFTTFMLSIARDIFHPTTLDVISFAAVIFLEVTFKVTALL